MDSSSSLSSGTSFSSGVHLSQAKSHGKGTERSLESVLYGSKQKVSAIESMLRGLELFDRHNSSTLWSSSLDIGVDPPSSRDPPFPAAVPASNHLSNSLMTDSTSSSKKAVGRQISSKLWYLSGSTDSDTNDAKKIGAEEDFENFLGCLKDTNMQAQGVDPKRGWGFRGVHKWQPPD